MSSWHEVVDRLCRAMARGNDRPEIGSLAHKALAPLVTHMSADAALTWERVLTSYAEAAERLPACATAEQIRAQALLIRRRAH